MTLTFVVVVVVQLLPVHVVVLLVVVLVVSVPSLVSDVVPVSRSTSSALE